MLTGWIGNAGKTLPFLATLVCKRPSEPFVCSGGQNGGDENSWSERRSCSLLTVMMPSRRRLQSAVVVSKEAAMTPPTSRVKQEDAAEC